MLLLLTLACQPDASLTPIQDDPAEPSVEPSSEPTEEFQDEETSESSTAYTYESDDEEAPRLSMAEVAMGVEQVIEVLKTLDGPELHDTYQMFRDEDEHLCPMTYPYYGYDYWSDTCTTSDGVQFSGYAYGYNYDEPYQSTIYQYERQAYIYGDGTITLTDGSSFEIAGYSYTYEYIQTNSSSFPHYSYHYMYGDFSWDHFEDDPTNWLDDGYTVDYVMSAGYTSDDGGHFIDYQGGLSGIDGIVNAAVFDEFYLHDEGWGADCELEPSGTVSVRDEEGRWYVIEFQGAYYNGGVIFTPDCDGCGDVWQSGELIGEACPDFYALLDWEDVPWNR